ncbi:MAG TPA: hypothetical protein VM553_14190 [Dongiaceae bacterium]|nr:hypothetical protein [Dongiaceae bacterium]
MATTLVESQPRPFQWNVIFAGMAVALALTIVLTQFGGAIGLKVDAPLRGEGFNASWGIIATGIWVLWIQLLSSLAGGYAAGYLRVPTPEFSPHENELRDGLHGLTVWAASTVLVFIAIAVATFFTGLLAAQTDSQQAAQVVDAAKRTHENVPVIYAFAHGAISLVSGIVSWWAATKGGEHRLSATDHSVVWSFRTLRKVQ